MFIQNNISYKNKIQNHILTICTFSTIKKQNILHINMAQAMQNTFPLPITGGMIMDSR